MNKEEMIMAAEYWEAESKRKDSTKGYRAMAKRHAKVWRENAHENEIKLALSHAKELEEK